MCRWALCSVLCLSVSFVATIAAQIPNSRPRIFLDHDNAMITGAVYAPEGMGVAGAHVELRDPSSNALLGFTTTRSNGTFELYNIPSGTFEIVAEIQGEQVKETIFANGFGNHVDLRLSRAADTSNEKGPRISVVRLKVPAKARDRYRKGQAAYAQGKFEQAQKAVDQSLSIYPQNPEAITLHGLLALHNKDIDQATQDFQKAIDIDPDYELPYTAMSSVLNSQGKFDDAARATERAVAINPTAWQGYFEQAKALLGKGLYEKALQVANKAQTLGPAGFAAFHLLKAYAMVPLKLYKDANTELQAFLSHAPQGQDVSSVKLLLAKVQAEASAPSSTSAQGLALVSH